MENKNYKIHYNSESTSDHNTTEFNMPGFLNQDNTANKQSENDEQPEELVPLYDPRHYFSSKLNQSSHPSSKSDIDIRCWNSNYSGDDMRSTQNISQKQQTIIDDVTMNPWSEYKQLERQVAHAYSNEYNPDHSCNFNFGGDDTSHNVNIDRTKYEYIPMPRKSINSIHNYPDIEKPNIVNEFEEILLALNMVTIENVYQTSNPLFPNPSPEEWVRRLAEIEREFKKQFKYPDRLIWNSLYFEDHYVEQPPREPLHMFFDEEFKIWSDPPVTQEISTVPFDYQLSEQEQQIYGFEDSNPGWWFEHNQNNEYEKPLFYYYNHNRHSQEALPYFYYFDLPISQNFNNSIPMNSFNPYFDYQNQGPNINSMNYPVESSMAQHRQNFNYNKSDFKKSDTNFKSYISRNATDNAKHTGWSQEGTKTQKIDEKYNYKPNGKKIQTYVPILKETVPATNIKNLKILFKENDQPKKLPERVNKIATIKKNQCKTANLSSKKSNETITTKIAKSSKDNEQPKKLPEKVNKLANMKTLPKIGNLNSNNEMAVASFPKPNKDNNKSKGSKNTSTHKNKQQKQQKK